MTLHGYEEVVVVHDDDDTIELERALRYAEKQVKAADAAGNIFLAGQAALLADRLRRRLQDRLRKER